MEFKRLHWAVALLAAAFLQLALAAVLQRPHSDQINGWHAGVEIQIGSSLTSAAGRESPKNFPAAAGLSPSSQAQAESPAAFEPAFAATASHPESDEFKAVSLPIPQPEKAPTSTITSQPKHNAQSPPAVGEKASPKEEKKVSQRVEKKSTPALSGSAKSKNNGGQSTQTATLTSLRKRDSSAATGLAGAAGKGGGTDSAEIVSPDYYRSLAAWLEKHKRYPRRAIQRRQQGVVKVSFKIDRKGNLLSRKIVGSSGYRLLDEAADSLLQRASPMPGIPHHSTAQVLEVIVPIMYALR